MNDNETLDEDDYPAWVWELLDRHGDLAIRTDSPLGAAHVLLHDAAGVLGELAQTSFREQAMAPELLKRLGECEAMIADARQLAVLCPSRPEPGIVTALEDGTLQWSPFGADDPDPGAPKLGLVSELEEEAVHVTSDDLALLSDDEN